MPTLKNYDNYECYDSYVFFFRFFGDFADFGYFRQIIVVFGQMWTSKSVQDPKSGVFASLPPQSRNLEENAL